MILNHEQSGRRSQVALGEAEIEFIVVGGAAAVLQGAPITTQDLDIVHQRTPDNIARLVALLDDLDAFFRPTLSGRYIRPTSEHLAGTGHVNLTTKFEPLLSVRYSIQNPPRMSRTAGVESEERAY